MRGLLAFIAWSFCISIGSASFAAEPTAKMSQKLETTLRVYFCTRVNCHQNVLNVIQRTYCKFDDISRRKYQYLLTEANLPGLLADLTRAERGLVSKLSDDIEKAQIMDDFRFTKQHLKQCYFDLLTLFEENYEPTFNIELMK